ncbi:DUF4863 family protein [Rhodococcus pyridinivorans]|uniref:hypothetical protein n=1 Tax=Rhodococcus pyridinivorans TaxID=103816 RepID=UPI001C30DDEC|nr:hypothetical protein [Rhodococcus pyridinivorans]QXF82293.1 DUF4863 family protein [Rhodococcus pyridinivorans]
MQVEAAKGITTPFSKLKMVASPALLAATSRLNTSILALNQTTTQPFARQVAMKTAGDELANFINVFRTECGREQYPPSAAQRDAMSFMATLEQASRPLRRGRETRPAVGRFHHHPMGQLKTPTQGTRPARVRVRLHFYRIFRPDWFAL